MRVPPAVRLSRRTMLAGSVVAFALKVPASAAAQPGGALPVVVQLAWGDGEASIARRARLVAAISAALVQAGPGAAAAWVLTDA